MENFIAQLQDLIEATEDASIAEMIAALEITKHSLVLSCLTDEVEE